MASPEKSLPATDAEWPSARLRWVLLGAFLGLLALIFASGAAATRTLRAMHQQEQDARRALADRAQTLSNLYISIEVYNDDLGRYVGLPAEESDPHVRPKLDRETADIAGLLTRYPASRQAEEAAFLQALQDLYQRHRELYLSALAPAPGARNPMSGQVLTMRSQILDWSGQVSACSVHHQYSSRLSPFQAKTGTPFGSSGVPSGPTTIAAAAWSWVEKMLQLAQRTRAPSAVSVSMSTAVCTVMCSDPVIRAPRSGWACANSARVAIRPGISCSARRISLRPNSARPRSATLYGSGALDMHSPRYCRHSRFVGRAPPDFACYGTGPRYRPYGKSGALRTLRWLFLTKKC